jgi:DNA-binding transcriptional ArsR family regulator
MKELITFASAIADTTRLRILSLAHDHKTSAVEIADVLKQPLVEISQQIEHLSDAGLLKTDQEGKLVRLKRKPLKLLNVIFEHLAISAKKDPILRKDAKLAKRWREAKHSEEKTSRRALKKKSKKTKRTGEMAKTKPSKSKTKG